MQQRKADLQQLSDRIRENIIEKVNSDKEERVLKDQRRRFLLSLIFVLPLLAVGLYWRGPLWAWVVQGMLLVPILIVNLRVFADGFQSINKKRPGKNTLAAIGAIVSLLTLQLTATGIVLTAMALCRFSEAYVSYRLDDHLKKLLQAEPEDPQLEEGTIIEIPKGEMIPADGVITEGASAIEEEVITGERVPPTKGPGEPAFAGTRNLSAPICVRVSRCGSETAIARIIDHITSSIASRPPIADRAERAARILVFGVIALAGISALLWAVSGVPLAEVAAIAVSILLVANPYAFSIGVPTSILAATMRGAKNGILIRSADILELARDINIIAVNKTGTVTEGKPQISDVIALSDGFSLKIAGILEQDADHPIAREIYRRATEKYGALPAAENVTLLGGNGVRGTVQGKRYLAGNAVRMQENGIRVDLPEAQPLYTQGKTVIFFANESRVIGLIALRDAPRPIGIKGISRIEGMGIDVVMLTGDSPHTAEAIRGEVGIDRVYAGLHPQEKARVIEALRADGDTLVAMVGDGRDDAPSIEAADIGIAIGTGPDIDQSEADVTLLANDLMDVVRAISLSRKTIRYIRQDIVFAYCYNIAAIAAALILLVPLAGTVLAPVVAALCMCASQVLVALGALRIKTTRL